MRGREFHSKRVGDRHERGHEDKHTQTKPMIRPRKRPKCQRSDSGRPMQGARIYKRIQRGTIARLFQQQSSTVQQPSSGGRNQPENSSERDRTGKVANNQKQKRKRARQRSADNCSGVCKVIKTSAARRYRQPITGVGRESKRTRSCGAVTVRRVCSRTACGSVRW